MPTIEITALDALASADDSDVLVIDDVSESLTKKITALNLRQGRNLTTDGAKLDLIEAQADVTDAANVADAGAVMDSDFAGSNAGAMIRTGVGAYAVLKHNLSASAAPGATDDDSEGYAVGSKWVDTTADNVYECVDATENAAVWAHTNDPQDSSVIWRWNETDASQFVVSLDEIAGGSAALSVQQAAWGPVLRVAFPTKVTGEKLAVVTIADPGLTKDAQNRYRYELRFRLVGFSGTAAEWYAFGPAFLCNKLTGASFYGLANLGDANSAGRLVRVTAGTVALSGATPNWQTDLFTAGNAGHQTEFVNRVIAKHNSAAPGFMNRSFAAKAGVSALTVQDAPGSAYYVAQLGAFAAGWDSEVLDTCGVAVLGGTGTSTDQYFEIDDIQITKHPMDLP